MASQQYQPIPPQSASPVPNESAQQDSSPGDQQGHRRDVRPGPGGNGQSPKVKGKSAQPSTKKNKQPPHFEDAISDIFLAASLIILPTLILSAVFIGLVFRWRVVISVESPVSGDSRPFSLSLSLVNNTQSLSDSYFIDIEATTLVTIASWTSTAVSFLPAWAMMLLSYPIAARFWKSSKGSAKALTTPYQLWMLIDLCTGSNTALWNWTKYRLGPSRPSKRDRSNGLLALTAIAFMLCLTLGILILLADTWLHLTTTTVILQETQQIDGTLRDLGRTLSPTCRSSETCTVNVPSELDQQGSLINPSKAYRTLFDISNDTRVLSTEGGDGRLYSFYASANIPQNVSYRASTVALNTNCIPITQACNLTTQVENQSGPLGTLEGLYTSMPYKCSSTATGDLLAGWPKDSFYNSTGTDYLFLEYFNNTGLTQSYNPQDDLQATVIEAHGFNTYFTNNIPAYFVIGALVAAESQLMSDPNVVEHAGMAGFLLKCTSQVMDMTYSFSDGLASDLVATPADVETIRAVTNPFLIPQAEAWDVITSGLRKSGLQDTMKDLSATFAQTYSHAVLSLGVDAVVPAPALRQSISSVRQITRMPKAPFYTLLGLNFLYAIIGIVLAIVAFASKPTAIKPVQARLSGPGLVAALFEGEKAERNVTSLSQLFEENEPGDGKAVSVDRVALVPTTLGGLKFEKVSG